MARNDDQGSLRIQFTLAPRSRAQEPLRENGRDDDPTDSGALPEGRDAEQVEAVADHHHDEHADQRADDAPPPAIEARAADDDSGDSVEFESCSGERIDGEDLG